jgi:hypothetical protein
MKAMAATFSAPKLPEQHLSQLAFSPVGSTLIQLSEGSEELERWPPVRMPPAIGSNASFDLLTSMGHGLVGKVEE